VKFFDIESAFEFVSSAPLCSNTALVSKTTGETYWRSDMAGEDDFPDGYEEDPDLLEIPHKNELDCGQALVWRFVERELPEEYARVRGFFSRAGAYGRFKAFLEGRGLFEDWNAFESSRTEDALRAWCKDVGLDLDD